MAFIALLDASVLVPAALRDTLLRTADSYLYRPIWSEAVLAELEGTLTGDIGVRQEQAAALLQAMHGAFPDAEVEGFENLIPAMTVEPKDRHVAAAAVTDHAQVIVTLNLSDFPQAALEPYNVEAQSPDEFLEHLFDLDPDRKVEIIVEQAADLTYPPLTPRDVCAHLRRFAPRFADLVGARLLRSAP